MSIRAALSAFLNPPAASTPDDPATDKRNELKHAIFSNGRTIIIVAFVALLVWNATKQILTTENMVIIGSLVKIYLIIEGAVHLVTILGNMVIKVMELKAFMANDGKLDDNETAVLKDGKETVTAVASVTK